MSCSYSMLLHPKTTFPNSCDAIYAARVPLRSSSARGFVAACPCSSLGRLGHGEYTGGHDQFGDHSM